MLKIYSAAPDNVIQSTVAIGECDYKYAIEKLHPLLDRFQHQRKLQNPKFYDRLKRDIVAGCVMPAITVAFVEKNLSKSTDIKSITEFIDGNISDGYVLDGMQRLNTLSRASEIEEFDENRVIPVSIVIAERYDFLLYRMITLNNGQKPMTARHQIEMLTQGLLDTSKLKIEVVTEKETERTRPRKAYKQSDLSEAYIAFLSDSLHNQNSRIIESKLDEILVRKVMESQMKPGDVSFPEVLEVIEKLNESDELSNWLRLGNNLIGFVVGAKRSCPYLKNAAPETVWSIIEMAEKSFASLETSKVNVGKVRREWAAEITSKIPQLVDKSQSDIDELFVELTL